jgi:hypothetical protein
MTSSLQQCLNQLRYCVLQSYFGIVKKLLLETMIKISGSAENNIQLLSRRLKRLPVHFLADTKNRDDKGQELKKYR